MAKVELTPAPWHPAGTRYEAFKPWLLENFFQDLCSYCLQQYATLSVEHYEPQKYAESRINDPTNLLLGCANCQPKKSDYHPLHTGRRRLPRDTTGFRVLDVRNDDLNEWCEVLPSGELRARGGSTQARAVWNAATLLRLDLYDQGRKRLLHKLAVTEKLLEALNTGAKQRTPHDEAVLDVLVGELAERLVFFDAFGLAASDALRTLLEERRLVSEATIADHRRELLRSMREYMEEEDEVSYGEKNITACDAVLSDYLVRMSRAVDRDEGLTVMRTAVLSLNELNETCDGQLIETDQREDICAILSRAAMLRGFCAEDEDPTEEWRDW